MLKNLCIPKKETQQIEFLEKYPEFDGRGMKMAIIDGGIDVSLPSLQKTSTGDPKIIDCFELTGNGSVDTSIIKNLDENNSLIALSERKLKIPLKWKNPSGNWHLGIKSLVKLCKQKYSDKDFERKLHNLMDICEKKMNSVKNENLNDSGKIIDCIVWNDGRKWCASLITVQNFKDLENVKVLTNFRDEHDYCFLVNDLNCCITISKDGNLLQICTSSYPHGTFVSQIAASHYPSGPKSMGGLAPGAQIYFMEVLSGDVEDGKCEKGLLKCVELDVNIINISLYFDISSSTQEKLREMQDRHGTIIVKSAGNEGPLFRTTETENEMDDQILLIGNLITPEMYKMMYNWKRPDAGLFCSPKNLSFINDSQAISTVLRSSRGPSVSNQSRGISFVAPGTAVVLNAQWYSKNTHLFGGTSAAAPNAAGSIACLLSALKATSMPYSPALIKFALENTAIPLKDKLASGAGIIQIDAAFEFLKTFSKINHLPIPFPKIGVKDTNLKGICIFETTETKKYCINVEGAEGNNIPWILKLLPESSTNYICHSKTVKNGIFDVEIRANSLEHGKVNYAEIHGFHPSSDVGGSFFHLPITVIAPENIPSNFYEKEIKIQTNIPTYIFIRPLPNSNKCTFKLSSSKYQNFLENTVEAANSDDESNIFGALELTPPSCDLSIRWLPDFFGFQVCFHKQSDYDIIEYCNFEVKFFENLPF